MLQRHLTRKLAALVDGQLPPAEVTRAAAHVSQCDRCRAARDEHQFAAGMLRGLTLVEAPAAIWTAIEAAQLAGGTFEPSTNGRLAEPPRLGLGFGRRELAWAATILLVAAIGALWQITRPDPHDVVRLDQASDGAPLSVGEWIETDATSRARIRIGAIGTVDIAPNTRMQLLTAHAAEHRLNLARGSISAQITAPPRLFFVETPSSTVVDLGCAYTMDVDDTGAGRLRVTSGWASLEWDKLESLVPAGASCPTRPEIGPGTPAFDDASERLREALLDFDYGGGASRAVEIVLAEARPRDTLTLWHLLSRVALSDRPRIVDRMVGFAPLPAGVTREAALALDPAALKLWREELAWTW